MYEEGDMQGGTCQSLKTIGQEEPSEGGEKQVQQKSK